MRSILALNPSKLAVRAVLMVGLTGSALASCGDSLLAMTSGKATVSQSPQGERASSLPSTTSGNGSIVGLWHVYFKAGGQTIQEAYQVWNTGGTEIHNPNVDPRAGNVCLGTWAKTSSGAFKLNHFVWNYDTNGDFNGTIRLHEVVTLDQTNRNHSGTFKLDFYDPTGAFVTEVTGNVVGHRVSIE